MKEKLMRVLITGASGYVGRHLTRGLEGLHELRLADMQPLADKTRFVSADVTRLEDMLRVTDGIDAVVHLAVASGLEGEVEDDAFNPLRFDVNVKGTYNVLEAARRHGVRRVVHTSSIMVAWGYPPHERVASDAPPRTAGTYSLTKSLAEAVCEHFVRNHRMSIVCLRIPKPIDPRDPRWQGRRIRPQWLAFADLIQAYQLALTAADIGFEIITVVAEAAQQRWELEKARRILGYRPTAPLQQMGFEMGNEREPF
jgi:uronate dehydrogenase